MITLAARLAAALAATAVLAAASASATPKAQPELAFERSGDIHVIRADGTGLRRLVATAKEEFAPSWSPDGRRVAFARYVAPRNSEIFVLDTVTGRSTRITNHKAEDFLPHWSPDGGRLVFQSVRSGGWELYVVAASGGTPRRITHDASPQYGNTWPSWAPGERILFSGSASTPENQEVYTIRPNGTRRTRLTFTKGDIHTLGDDASPAWSQDGKRIVFSSNREGSLAIWTMRADGKGQRRLVDLDGRDESRARYSADGSQIAFESLDGTGRFTVYVARSNGTGVRRLTVGGAPSWRP